MFLAALYDRKNQDYLKLVKVLIHSYLDKIVEQIDKFRIKKSVKKFIGGRQKLLKDFIILLANLSFITKYSTKDLTILLLVWIYKDFADFLSLREMEHWFQT